MTPDPRSDEELNRIIAEWMGWRFEIHVDGTRLVNPSGRIINNHYAEDWRLPQHCTDMNAIHNATEKLTLEQKTDYIRLVNKGDFSYRQLAFADARQRAEALVKVIEEGKK